MNPELKQRVLEIYSRADADVRAAGPRCDASGRCCRFKEYDHTLFISQLEAEVLLDSCPPYEKPVNGEFCPFQIDGLCTAREPRPLGCRVYFCDPAYQETGLAISERYLAELKRLADESGTAWNYAPLHLHLNAGEARVQGKPDPDGRMAADDHCGIGSGISQSIHIRVLNQTKTADRGLRSAAKSSSILRTFTDRRTRGSA